MPIKKSINSNSKWTTEFLKTKSYHTDPYAEQVMREVIEQNEFKDLRSLFISLSNNSTHIHNNKDLPPQVIEYFNREMELPAWADEKKIALAQDVFSRFGPQVALVLNFKALPLCYACRNGAKVLASTHRLNSSSQDTSRITRRLMETSQMVINVMAPGGLSANGQGLVTVKKVRLYHATIRQFLLNPKFNPEGWDVDYYGQPINQEEMAGTLMAFSALVLHGLEQLDVDLTEEEKDAYIHVWNVVGHFIGIDPELYPANYQEGWDLGIAIINRNKERSQDGIMLTDSLMEFTKQFFGGVFFKNIPEYLVDYFMKDVSQIINADLSLMLEVGNKTGFFARLKGKIFIKLLQMANNWEERSAWLSRYMRKHSVDMMKGMTSTYLHTNKVEFYIPDSLKASWNMK